MNSEDIYDGITDIRDDQINGAEKSPKGRKPRFAGWFVAAAAMLTVVVTSAVLFRHDGRLPVKTETEPVGTTAAEETEASTLPIITSAHGDETAYGMFDTEGNPAATEPPAAAPEQTTTNLPTTRDPETEQDICGYPTEPPATTKAPETTAAQTTSPKTTLPIEHIAARQLASAVKPEQAQHPTYPESPQGNYTDEEYQAYKAAADEYHELENICYEQFRSRRELSSEYKGTLEGFNGAVAEQLLSGAGSENRVCSPTSLYLALSMLAETTDGTSRGQILELLGCESIEEVRARAEAVWEANYIDDGRDKALLANSLWLNSAYLGSYNADTVNTLAEVYYADSFCGTMGDEDYNEMLRKWINDNTGGRLEEQANGLEFPQDTVLGLASTVYFKGRWNEPFVEGNTAPDVFHAEGGDITVDFMHQRIDDADYYRGEGFSAIEKNMRGSSMKIILPDEGVSVDELLASGQVGDFLASFSDSSNSWENRSFAIINLSLPKFDVASDIDLADSLKALGVTDVLDKERSDFSPMFTEGNAYLDEAKHAARVTVDEEGVEAAAYTVMLANPTSQGGADLVVDFIADRPFIFAITGEGGALLFAGVVNNPAE